MSERGSGLLDAVAATAIGVLVASTATDTVTAIRTLGAVGQRDRLLVTARNILEHAVGAPCAASAPCPTDMSCSIDRVLLATGPPVLAHVRVTVEAVDDDTDVAPVRLSGVSIESCS